MKKLNIILKSKSGLHARPASLLINCVKNFESEIMVEKEGNTYNPSSMMSLLSMEAGKGTELIFTIKGSDEVLAFEALKELLSSNLN